MLDTWDRVWVRHGGAKQVLSSAQSGEGCAAAGHCPVHGGHLPGISVSCSTAGQEPSHSDNQCPLVLSGLPSPLWVVQRTVSDCLQRKGRLVCVCVSSDEAMSISQVKEVTYLIHFQPWHLCPRATLSSWPGAFLLHPCPPYLPTGHLWL